MPYLRRGCRADGRRRAVASLSGVIWSFWVLMALASGCGVASAIRARRSGGRRGASFNVGRVCGFMRVGTLSST